MPLFIDPDKPIRTCASENCDGCDVADKLHCHFSATDLVHFMTLVFPLLIGWFSQAGFKFLPVPCISSLMGDSGFSWRHISSLSPDSS